LAFAQFGFGGRQTEKFSAAGFAVENASSRADECA
jgi:hypothetical protein